MGIYLNKKKITSTDVHLDTDNKGVYINAPQGVVDTAADLPADVHNGIYITKDTGHWYYYSDGWVDGGVYENAGGDVDLSKYMTKTGKNYGDTSSFEYYNSDKEIKMYGTRLRVGTRSGLSNPDDPTSISQAMQLDMLNGVELRVRDVADDVAGTTYLSMKSDTKQTYLQNDQVEIIATNGVNPHKIKLGSTETEIQTPKVSMHISGDLDEGFNINGTNILTKLQDIDEEKYVVGPNTTVTILNLSSTSTSFGERTFNRLRWIEVNVERSVTAGFSLVSYRVPKIFIENHLNDGLQRIQIGLWSTTYLQYVPSTKIFQINNQSSSDTYTYYVTSVFKMAD